MFKDKLCILLATISFALADIDFMDCGSENVWVDQVDIVGCVDSPCPIVRGYSHDVYITPIHLDPRVDSIQLETYVQLWGAYFYLPSTCTNPCGTACPLNNPLDRPRLKFTIEFPRTLQRSPAQLHLVAYHRNMGQIRSKICVNVDVDLM